MIIAHQKFHKVNVTVIAGVECPVASVLETKRTQNQYTT